MFTRLAAFAIFNVIVAPALGQDAKPAAEKPVATALEITTRKPTDRVAVKIDEGTARIDIFSPSGIGAASIKLTKGRWSAKVVLRLHLKGLESLAVAGGRFRLQGSVLSHSGNTRRLTMTEVGKEGEQDPGTQIRVLDAAGKPVEGLPGKDGYFEIALPRALFQDAPASLELSWIDFYR